MLKVSVPASATSKLNQVKCDWLRLKLYFPTSEIDDITFLIRRIFGEVHCKLQYQKTSAVERTPSNDFRD